MNSVSSGQWSLDFVPDVGSHRLSLATESQHILELTLLARGRKTIRELEEKLGDWKELVTVVQIRGDYCLDQDSMQNVKERKISRLCAKKRTQL